MQGELYVPGEPFMNQQSAAEDASVPDQEEPSALQQLVQAREDTGHHRDATKKAQDTEKAVGALPKCLHSPAAHTSSKRLVVAHSGNAAPTVAASLCAPAEAPS